MSHQENAVDQTAPGTARERDLSASADGTLYHRLFQAHPEDIGESYREHAGHALVIGLRMVAAGLACLVHALIPGLFVRTASHTVNGIVALMQQRETAARAGRGLPIR
jgi:hypothetical protein